MPRPQGAERGLASCPRMRPGLLSPQRRRHAASWRGLLCPFPGGFTVYSRRAQVRRLLLLAGAAAAIANRPRCFPNGRVLARQDHRLGLVSPWLSWSWTLGKNEVYLPYLLQKKDVPEQTSNHRAVHLLLGPTARLCAHNI